MTKHRKVTERVTKEISLSTSAGADSDGMTKGSMKTLFYIFIFLPLGSFRKTLRHRHSVTIRPSQWSTELSRMSLESSYDLSLKAIRDLFKTNRPKLQSNEGTRYE